VNVAALALDAAAPAAIKNAAEAAEFAAQLRPCRHLSSADVAFATVAQDEEIEPVELAGLRQRLISGTQAGKHPRDVFVADRHDDCRPGRRVDRFSRRSAPRN